MDNIAAPNPAPKKKLCFVIQRYGLEINGGAETYTRCYAEKLSNIYNITVLTTCALDYQQWHNHYDDGLSVINDVKVIRYKVDVPRDENFVNITSKIYNNPTHSIESAYDWVTAQGPVCSGLIEYIKDNSNNYDLFFFFTYLYYPTVFGLPLVAEKSILVPFCHDEPPIYLKCFDEIFNLPCAIIFNADEEKSFVHNLFDNTNIPSIQTGIGVDIPNFDNSLDICKKFKLITRRYMLYMGRIDESKGCHELFEYFETYKKRSKSQLILVLIGKEIMPVPKSKDIISLGFVSEDEKYALLDNCEFLVLPSHFESLSIVVLEAFALKKSVLVCGLSSVLKGHCLKSNGGLYFYAKEDFCDCLSILDQNKALLTAMGEKGNLYFKSNYQWDVLISRFTTLIG